MPTLPQEIIDEIFALDERYKKIEDNDGGKTGEIHFQRRQEVRRLRMDLMELLTHAEDLGFEEIKRRLRHQATLLKQMEEEFRNNN